MILLIDNYDSFTYNLYHYLLEIGANVIVYRNDAINISQIAEMKLNGIVMSPGPCTPHEAGICVDLVAKLGSKIPMLGVCLGHQAIGQAFGAEIVRGKEPMHAKISTIHHRGSPLFTGIPETFKATRYHSLIIRKTTLPKCLSIIAYSDDNVIQAIKHKEYLIYGVQFHPESIASQHGHKLLVNFFNMCKRFQV